MRTANGVIVEAATGTERLLNVVKRAVRDNNDLSGSVITWSLQVMKKRDFKEDLQMTSTAGDAL